MAFEFSSHDCGLLIILITILAIVLISGVLALRDHAAVEVNSQWLFMSVAAIFTIVVIMLFLLLLVCNILAIAGAFCNAGQQTR